MKKVTKEEQKIEAIERLKMLNLCPNVLTDFVNEDLVNVSEQGILYWVDEKEKTMIKEFEEKHNALVYHVIHSHTAFGELYSYLYVSEYRSEWKLDKKDIKDGYPLVYVKNVDDDCCSEFGAIGIQERFGGLIRTA